MSSEILFSCASVSVNRGGQHRLFGREMLEVQVDTAGRETLSMCGKIPKRENGDPIGSLQTVVIYVDGSQIAA